MAKPQTIVRDGSGTQTVSYVLPPGVFQYIESVRVVVDNGAAVDVKPELSIATVNGVVMADKRQNRAIPAGGSGGATWALRLNDDAGGGIEFDAENTGDYLDVLATGTSPVFGTSVYVQGDNAVQVGSVNAQALLYGATAAVSADTLLELLGPLITALIGIGGEFNVSWGITPHPLRVTDTFIRMHIADGNTLLVQSPSGGDIFQIDSDGALHGKTGQALTFDL